FGLQYQALLAREGIDVTVRPTSGSVENIQLLQNGQADVAFVQGGTGTSVDAPSLRALASLYYEPVWILLRRHAAIQRLSDLRGRRVALDHEGSGTRAIALLLLADDGIAPKTANLLPLGGEEAVSALRAGRLDAASFVISPRAPVVRECLAISGD